MIDAFGVEVISKADRRDAETVAGAAATAGTARSANYHRQGAKKLATLSRDEKKVGDFKTEVGRQRIVRHGLPAGTPGKLPLGAGHSNIAATHRFVSEGMAHQANAKNLAQASFGAARRAKGRAAVAVGLAGGTAALARRPKRASGESVSYR